jgi:CRP-like cAMP-binding protein
MRSRLSIGGTTLHRVGVAWFVVNVSEWIYVTALTVHEYRLHGAIALGLIGARFIPGAVIGSFVHEPLTRRRPGQALALLSYLRCVLIAAVMATVIGAGPLTVVVALIWLDSVISAPYRPIQSALFPALANTPQELSSAAGGVPTSKALGQALGALIGSFGLAVISAQALVGIAVGAMLLPALMVTRVSAGPPVLPTEPAEERSGRFGAVTAGFELVASRAGVLLILGGTRSLMRGLWGALSVVVAIRLLGIGNGGVGALGAASGVGAAIAVPVAMRFTGRKQLASPAALSFAAAGVPIVLLTVLDQPAAAIALIVVWGLAMTLADSFSNALLHRAIEAHQLGAASGALESSKQLLEGLGAIIAPGLLAIAGIHLALVIAGAPLPILVALSVHALFDVNRRAEDRGRPVSILLRTPVFKGLTMLSLESIGARLRPANADSGNVIITQGDVGGSFYLIDSGQVEVTVDSFRVSVLGPGNSFGERALLRQDTRSATVTALEPTSLWCLDAGDFIAAATGREQPAMQRVWHTTSGTLEEILEGVPQFAALNRREVAQRGELLSVVAGQRIISEGEAGDRFYVVLDGEARVTIDGQLKRSVLTGDWFGEIALLHPVARTATVTAVGEVSLWSLRRESFLELLDGSGLASTAVAGSGMGQIV